MLLHAGLALAVVAAVLLSPRDSELPDRPAELDLVIGTNASHTGGPATPAPAPQPPDATTPPAPPAPRVAPQAAAAPTAAEPIQPPTPAPPAQVPPPDPQPQVRESPVAATAGPSAAAAPTAAQAPIQPSQPDAGRVQADAAPSAPPDVRMGEGIAGLYAEIDDIGRVHRATPDTGNVPPDYPPEAARLGQQGAVTLRVYILADGSVMRVDVARSSGWPILDRAARDRISTWHFRPATRDGKPIPAVEEQTIRFTP